MQHNFAVRPHIHNYQFMEKIKGLIDAPFTPMHANGDVNLDPIPAYAAMLAKNGLKGVFINYS